MKVLKYYLTVILYLLLHFQLFPQGMTTSGINGKISDHSGETLPGATVIAVHLPSGSNYATVTDQQGFFRLPNMNVGGPYKLTVSYVGFDDFTKEDIYLTLGQTFEIDARLSDKVESIDEVQVVKYRNDIFDGNRTGSETVIDQQSLAVLPTITRNLNDFTRLTPQVMTYGGGISVAGVNNRYNSLMIDGAVNNDVFGLASSGTNGGQLGITPISIDAIDQFQVVLAPYDVRQGGFAGGGINAVTRSGSNSFSGSAYYMFRNENFSGLTPTDNEAIERTKLAAFTAKTYGLRLGGPIIKDKVFFFINAEQQRDEIPRPFNFSDYTGNMAGKRDSIDLIISRLNGYDYELGTFENTVQTTNSDKILARFDMNLGRNHKLMIRHHYTKGQSVYPYNPASNATNITFYNNWINFTSVTNSSSAELKSRFGAGASNSLVIGYTTVKDDRDPNGDNFPIIVISDGAGKIYAGSEEYSTGNELNQNIFTITDNLNLYFGKHTITIGTHNEFYKIYNLFIRQNFGRYDYSSVAAFLNGSPASSYSRSYSLVDNVVGDGSSAAADFNAMQFGFYIQDEFKLSDKLRLTGGIRLDIPVFSDKPLAITQFDTTAAKIEAAGYEIYGAASGQMPGSQLLISPRIGFNFDVFGDKRTQLRGGAGIFTSRIPFVWPAGSYTNCGLVVGGFSAKNVAFRSEWNNQYTATDLGATIRVPSGQLDLFAEDFKYPQVLRASLGLDQKLPFGLIGTFDFLYTKTLNNVLYYNVNIKPSIASLTGSPDNRPVFQGSASANLIEPAYSGIYVGTNTNKGYTYNFTGQLQKPFLNGLQASIAYTYGQAKSINDGTSSQNSSQWRYIANIRGRNDLDLSYSNYDLGSRFVAFVSYRKEYIKHAATTVSLYYNGQSGSRYSYVYLDGYKMTNQDYRNDQDLIYIPSVRGDINLIDYTYTNSSGQAVTVTADEQWNALVNFIESDPYLKKNKGGYAERNGSRTPFENTIDLRISQDFFINGGNSKHTLQVGLDIFNLGNFLNKDWGRKYYISNGTYSLIKFESFETGTTTPRFTYRRAAEAGIETQEDIFTVSDSGIGSSRWYGQVSVRYIF
ncbi:MAG: TonB-dependent receptor [Bacteroidales bacterium]|nr:TonB-dependent receptor [Bacteroidales bacterium]